MGAGVSHLILVNRTGYQVMVTAQLVQPKPDRPIEDPKIVQVAANGTTTLDLTRNQNFDVRCNIIFNLSNGSSGRIRINVPPKEITRNIDITHGMILVDGNNSGSIVGGIETPPAYEEDAGSLKPFVDGVPEKPVPQPISPNTMPKGSKVIFTSLSSGKSLRLLDAGRVDGLGSNDKYAQFSVEPSPNGYLRLQSVNNPSKYLAIKGGMVQSGSGGSFSELTVLQVGDFYSIRSAHDQRAGVGVTQAGIMIYARNVKFDTPALFEIKVL